MASPGGKIARPRWGRQVVLLVVGATGLALAIGLAVYRLTGGS